MFLFLLGKYLDMEVLSHRVNACLPLQETASFPEMFFHVHTPTRNILTNTALSLFIFKNVFIYMLGGAGPLLLRAGFLWL